VSALLGAELLKLRTTRTFFTLIALAVALSLLVVVLTLLLTDEIAPEDLRNLFTADFTGLFILLLGVIGMAGEWRHRTITSTVLAAPRRLKLLVAKVLSYAAAGAVLSFIVTITIMIVGSLILSASGDDGVPFSDLVDVLWRNLLVAALLGALGVCIGALVRNQIVAIVGLLVASFALEPTLFALAPEVGRFSPLIGAPSAVAEVPPLGEPTDDLLAPFAGVIVMLGWIGLFFAAAGARLRGGDLV